MSLFRPAIEQLAEYIPGEQPQQSGWVKLNTNENPYLPSPAVAAAVAEAASGRLNIYPDPLSRRLRAVAAEVYGVEPEWILPGNGSDEILTILVRSFVDAGEQLAYPYPSYVLYETLAEIQGATVARMPLNADWTWNLPAAREVAARSKLVLVPNPNSPSGTLWDQAEIEQLIPPTGLLVLDEAYGDFTDQAPSADILSRPEGERVVITRTLSKSYALAGIRCGFAIAHPDVIRGMEKVKDSYNLNTLTLAAAAAAMSDQEWLREISDRIRLTRSRLTTELAQLGFDVVPSQANFVWATRSEGGH
ncbi:MAG: histidinol-phosphate aminotransferase family protein, partial [Planctomycetaceae bacterium]|nr:histidinol-phosphate aminotransferase family protein [Planctomycetaceae bacterium]